MSAQPNDVVALAREPATRQDMFEMFAPRKEEHTLSNGKVVWLRPLTVEERARTMNIEDGMDVMTIMLACGVVDANGNPIFGVYKDALPFIRGLSLSDELLKLAQKIATMSGMSADAEEDASAK